MSTKTETPPNEIWKSDINRTLAGLLSAGWLRDLTRECVEANPGPSAWDVLEFLAMRLNTNIEDKDITQLYDKIVATSGAEFPSYDNAKSFLTVDMIMAVPRKDGKARTEADRKNFQEYLLESLDASVNKKLRTLWEAIDQVQWGPFYFYPPLLASALSTLQNELDKKSGDNPTQENKLIALYQLTRFGKTKLCYSLGFSRCVVILRWKDLKFDFQAYLENCDAVLRQAAAHNIPQECYETVGNLVIRNQKLVTVWVLCYVELLKLLYQNAAFAKCTPLERFEYFLRISSNRIARDCISKIFANQIGCVEKGYNKHVEDTLKLAKNYKMVFVFDDFLPHAAKVHLTAFPHKPEWDLVKEDPIGMATAIGKRQMEEWKPTIFEGKAHTEGRLTSLFYSFLTLAEEFATAYVPSIFVSTQFRTLHHMLDDEFVNASSRDRLAILELVFASESLTVPIMIDFLVDNLTIFATDPTLDIAELARALEPFEGRTGFFFDIFWGPLLPTIVKNPTITPKELFNTILTDLKGRCLTLLDAAIRGYIQKFIRSEDDKKLMRKLYYFQVMHAGYAAFNREDKDAVNAGFAFLVEVQQDSLSARMFQEPRVRKIFLEKVLLGQINTLINLIPPDKDLIYQEIDAFHTNKGLAGEEYAMRLFMRLAATQQNLFTVLHGGKYGVDEASVASYVRFSHISQCGTAAELGIDELDFLLNPNRNVQLRSAYGRVDIITPLEWLPNAPKDYLNYHLPPASSQVKNLQTHITPSLFYTCDGQFGALTSLDPSNFFPLSPNNRERFEKEYSSKELYHVYIRIIVSTLGFNEEVEKAVIDFNHTPRGLTQPIFLVPLADYISENQVPSDLLGREHEPTPSRYSATGWKLDGFVIPARLSATPATATTSATPIAPQRQIESRYFQFNNKKARITPPDEDK